MKKFANEEYNDLIIVSIRESTLSIIEKMLDCVEISEGWDKDELEAAWHFVEEAEQYKQEKYR